jgi:protein-S-isoprenylcysteine O-methyltransferase Ste14
MTLLKSLFFLISVPGVFIGVIPFLFLMTGPYIEAWLISWLAFPLWVVGGVMILWSFWNFLVNGHGTPAPMDPPKELVVAGFYRHVRNPMYVGVLLMLLSEFLWLGYLYLLAYAFFFFIAFHLFILEYEEPALKKKFGRAYENYLKTVPRWIPRFKR